MWKDHHGSVFITLTYRSREECNPQQLEDGLHVPDDFSLNKNDFQKFIRRLRDNRTFLYSDADPITGRRNLLNPIRYFHCGEYGPENLRPHYHACLFNKSFDDQILFKDDEGFLTYTSEELANAWQYGFCTVSPLSFHTAAYTAGYILTKITGHAAIDAYLRNDADGVAYWVTPPYVTMSLKPGIGADFYQKYKKDFFPSDTSPVPGTGTFQLVPRYYETILANENPELLETVKAIRQIFIREHGEDFTPERLMDKYKVAQARNQYKKRDL